MNKFSKWNKRITAWLLLLAGFYMGFFEYAIEYVILFLCSGVAVIGLSIWQNVKTMYTPGHPPPDDDEDDKNDTDKEI